jgi:fimbrial isopeptide formation D2 family protein/LPXTG-motif cell wall-anchored protein
MKKKFGKLVTLFSAALLLLGTAVPALAADVAPDKGNLIIHKYLMTNTADAGANGTGEPVSVPTGAVPLAGITFKLYKVAIASDGIYPAPGKLLLNTYANTTSFTDSNGKAFTVSAAAPSSVLTDTAGEARANDLPQGIYLVVEVADPRVASPAAPFVVSVPMINPTGDTWLTDVHVYPKNESMSIEKKVANDSVQIGSVIDYTIIASIPTDINAVPATAYKVTDALDKGLTYVGILGVKAGLDNTSAAFASGIVLTSATHYGIVITPPSGAAGEVVTLTLTQAGKEFLANGNYKFLEIVLEVKVNAGILEKSDYVLGNLASLEFLNEYGELKTAVSGALGSMTNIHTAQIKITKLDSVTSTLRLAGAKFKLATSEQNAKDAHYLRKDANGVIYDYSDPGYNAATDWEITTASVADPGAGIDVGDAIFAGLQDHGGTTALPSYRTYWLVETKAPAGYNPLSAAQAITFDATAAGANRFSAYATVYNNKGFTLPKTGGIGNVVFTVSGVALIGISLILIIVTAKTKKKDHGA